MNSKFSEVEVSILKIELSIQDLNSQILTHARLYIGKEELNGIYSYDLFLIYVMPLNIIKNYVRSGIRTHAWKTRLRPERSALDHSAILT